MSIKKLRILSLYIVASLTLAACDSTTNSSTPIAVSSPTPETITVSGKAAKGLVFGGVVDVHLIVDGIPADTTIESGLTNTTDGNYSLQSENNTGAPFLVRVSAADDGSTTMRCDLANGCGENIEFGDDVIINDPDFTLDAIIVPTGETMEVNVSVLTDTAATIALENLANNSGVSIEESLTIVSNANSSLANRFGIQGDITTLPVVDLTDPSAVAAASNNTLIFNLLSSAIVEAMIGGDPTLSITDAVRGFSTQFITNGGLADTESSPDASITLAEILAHASNIIDAIQTSDTNGLTNLATLESIIDTNQRLAQNGSTIPHPGTPTDPTLSDLDKAQAMVQSLRELQAASFTDAEAFSERVELASNSLDNDAGDVIQALIYAAEAIGSASNAHSDDNTITTFTDSDTNITVAIATTNTDITYDVETTINVGSTPVAVAVDITAIDKNSNAFLDEMDDTTNEISTAFTVGLDIQGTASSDYAELDITSGTVTVMAAIIEETLTDSDTETVDADITDFTLDLNVSLSEVSSSTTPDPITFTGNILLSIDNVVVDSSKTGTYVMGDDGPVSFLETWDESITFDEVTFLLVGKFEAPSGANLSASVRMAADGTDFTYSCSNTSGIPGDEMCNSDSDLVDITLNATTKVDVSGISTEEGIKLSVIQSRTDAQNDDPLIIMSYDETLLTIMPSEEESTNGTSELTLIVTNQNNVTMIMIQTEAANESVISGNITVNGVEQATISDDQGTVIITYIDGFNESF